MSKPSFSASIADLSAGRYACRVLLLLAPASVTDSLVTLATHIIRDLGLAGVSR